jgi:hypothetical protein
MLINLISFLVQHNATSLYAQPTAYMRNYNITVMGASTALITTGEQASSF